MPTSEGQELFFEQSDLQLTRRELTELAELRHMIGVEGRLHSPMLGRGDYVIWNGRVRRAATGRLHLMCHHRVTQNRRWEPPIRGMSMNHYTIRPLEAR